MALDISRAPVSAPPAVLASEPRPPARLFRVSADLRAELDSLRLDEEGLASWSGLTLRQVRLVLGTGFATRVQVRRIRRGLRWAWTDKAGEDAEHWLRLTLRYLAPDVK